MCLSQPWILLYHCFNRCLKEAEGEAEAEDGGRVGEEGEEGATAGEEEMGERIGGEGEKTGVKMEVRAGGEEGRAEGEEEGDRLWIKRLTSHMYQYKGQFVFSQMCC